MLRHFPINKKTYLYFIIILLIIYPISPYLFNIFLDFTESQYSSPIKSHEKLSIRYDSLGDGHFKARRGGGRRKHMGVDIKAPIGEDVLALKSGEIITGFVKNGMGKYVKIKHKDDYVTLYGHLSKVVVNDKQWVWQGAKIGEVGKTGNANRKAMHPHIHLELRHKKEHLNPQEHLKSYLEG